MNYRLVARVMREDLNNRGLGKHPVERDPAGISYGHVLWMLEQARDDSSFSEGKANRWIGWVQALCCVWGYHSLDELKSLNQAASCDDEGCPRYGELHHHVDLQLTEAEMDKIKRGHTGEFSIEYDPAEKLG